MGGTARCSIANCSRDRNDLSAREVAERRVGYGHAHIHELEEAWIADTWSRNPKIGEIESVSVLPDYRNQGIGTRLLDRLEREPPALAPPMSSLARYPATRQPSPCTRGPRLTIDLALKADFRAPTAQPVTGVSELFGAVA
jgi:GNAT superfamily N-acetyltransferase